MLVRYREYVARAHGVAVLQLRANRHVHANTEGRRLLERSNGLFEECFLEAAQTGLIVSREIGGSPLAFVPLFGEPGGVEAVLATSSDVRELPRLLHELHDARIELERSQRRVSLLAEAGRVLNGATEPPQIARSLVRLLAEWSGGTAVVELREGDKRVAVAAQPSDGQLFVERIRSVLARRGRLEEIGVPGLHAVAIRGSGRARGFIAVVCSPSRGDSEPDDVLLADVAERTATALENALAYHREHRIATELQRAMLPVVLPRIPGVAFDVAYTPADAAMLVGGDWYDAFVLRDGRVAVAVGDVAGSGLDAAIVMANVRRTIRSAALDRCGPTATLALANIVVCVERCPMVTAFFGILDPLTQRMEYACAGHPPPIAVESSGALCMLEPDGPPLGVNEATRLRTHTIDLAEDSALVLYTDGVVEAGRDLVHGESLLRETLRRWGASHFTEGAEGLQARIMGPALRSDDAAMLIVRLIPVDELDVTFPATLADSHRARLAVERYVRETVLGEERAADFTLAIAEAMNNAAEHAYTGEGGVVHVRVRVVGGTAVAVIEDDGRWRGGSAPDRGRGITMMRALADECDLARGEHGTKVRLAMHMPVQGAAFGSA